MTDGANRTDLARDRDVDDNLKYVEDSDCREESIGVPVEHNWLHLGAEVLAPDTCLKYAWYQIDDSSLPLLTHIEPSLRRKFLALGLLPGPRRYEIGRFRLHEDHLAVFDVIPALEEVGYSEELRVSSESAGAGVISERSASPLQRFLQLADKNDPVPQILIDLDDSSEDASVVKLLSGRDIVDSLEAVGGQQSESDLVAAPGAAAADVWTCFGGGDVAFADAYCPNWAGDISYCDSGGWYNLIRSSGSSKRKYAFTHVASCHGTVYVQHYYRGWFFGWKWFKNGLYQTVGHGQVKSRNTGSWKKRRRRIHIFKDNVDPSIYFRAFTSFHN